jgi:hypothetical protein
VTKLLEKAFKEVSKLPEIEQNTIAKWIIEELKMEKKWDQAFAESEDLLDNLSDEAIKLHKSGKTIPLDIEKL